MEEITDFGWDSTDGFWVETDSDKYSWPELRTRTRMKNNRGGKREGAGRKPGSGKGRVAVTRSVSMHLEAWKILDEKRGDQSRGKWIEARIRRAR